MDLYSTRRMKSCLVVLLLPWLELVISSCWIFRLGVSSLAAEDTLRVGQEMTDLDYLQSSNGVFVLVFFNLYGSNDRYLGIKNQKYYKGQNGIENVIWVANRANPVMDSSAVLKITQEGKLMINGSTGILITLNSEQSQHLSINTSATLLDSGNFVLRSGDNNIVWQSFDYPSNIWLPGMKLGLFNLKSGKPLQHRFLTSRSSLEDPDAHAWAFSLGVDPNTKQLIAWKGSRGIVYWSSGMWDGYNFRDFRIPSLNFSYFSNENESYFTYYDLHGFNTWIRLDSFGVLHHQHSDLYEELAVNCDPNQSSSSYPQLTLSKGCVRPKPSNCTGGDVFNETRISMTLYLVLDNSSLDLNDCEEICKANCACEAYASPIQSYGSGCVFFRGPIISDNERDLYIRTDILAKIIDRQNQTTLPRNPLNNTTLHNHPMNTTLHNKPRTKKQWLTIGGSVASLLILTSLSLLCYLRWRHRCFKGGSNKDGIVQGMQLLMDELNNSATTIDELSNTGKLKLPRKKDRELPFISFSAIEIVTEYFSERNKIGQGGYGLVYKGMLVNGQEIAIKRLSSSSRQGLQEFKNEVILISRLQHRNLVRLLGYCTQKDERILIYEYLPNKSLDFFLFDETKQYLLDWKMRVSIIGGIAQGLLYLHKYSRLRIIHRDLKTSNILLDKDMNPKISDFGTARIFSDNENQANTNKIVGTHGYMSPEYAMDGLFSVKSDVFSFGVMMLEIISGKKNTGFYRPDRALNLLGYAWDLWKEAKGLEIVHQALVQTCSISEAMRYIQVGFLCVQEIAADRPNMLDVVFMLTNETMVLPAPKQPAFSKIMGVTNASTPKTPEYCSINEVTISEIEVR